MNGIIARVASSVSPRFAPKSVGASDAPEAVVRRGVGDRLVVRAGDAEEGLVGPVEGGLEVGLHETSIRTNMIARPMRPRYRHHFWIRA